MTNRLLRPSLIWRSKIKDQFLLCRHRLPSRLPDQLVHARHAVPHHGHWLVSKNLEEYLNPAIFPLINLTD